MATDLEKTIDNERWAAEENKVYFSLFSPLYHCSSPQGRPQSYYIFTHLLCTNTHQHNVKAHDVPLRILMTVSIICNLNTVLYVRELVF